MNILKRMRNTAEFMTNAYKLSKNFPPERRKVFEEGMYYTVTLGSKIKAWQESGQKTFVLSKDLIEAFKHTDISLDMFPSDFRYPFDSFVVEGEVPFFETTTFNSQLKMGDTRSIDTIMYMSSEMLMNQAGVILMDADGVSADEPDWQHSLTAFFPGLQGGLENIMLYMRSDKTIGDAVEKKKSGSMILPISQDDAKGIANIFFNTVLYINDPSRIAAETESAHSRKMKISSNETVRSQYILLKPPKSYKSIYASSGKTLDKKFIVRGHWRNQAYGEGRLQRKMRWIFPFWKGPEMSEVLSKKYKVA